MKLDDAASRLEALGNPTRLKIFRALVRAGDKGVSVGGLQKKNWDCRLNAVASFEVDADRWPDTAGAPVNDADLQGKLRCHACAS